MRKYLFSGSIGLTALALFFLLFCLALKYPYYYSWDMDIITAIDVLVIQGGEHPAHMNHTGMGMYWLMKWTHQLATGLGWISTLKIQDLELALNPVLSIAEVVTFFKLHSPVICSLAALFLWGALWTMFPTTGLVGWSAFLALGLQQSYFYHTALIRSELYSIFFWSASVFCFALAARSRVAGGRGGLWLIFGAVLAGFSYQTKFQSLFYFASLPLIYFLFWNPGHVVEGSRISPDRKLATFNWIIVCVLMFAAWKKSPPVNQAVFTDRYALNTMGLLFLAVSTGLAAFWWALPKFSKRLRQLETYARFGNIFLLGLVVSLLFHFTFYSNFIRSLRYLQFDLQMLFFRPSYGALEQLSPAILFKLLFGAIQHNPGPYLFHGVGLVLLTLAAGRRERLLAIGISVLAYINSGVVTRWVPRDVLWQETILGFLGVLFLLRWLAIMAPLGMRWKPLFASVLMLFYSGYQAARASQASLILDAIYTDYGWNHMRVLEHYHNAQERYRVLVWDYFHPKNAPSHTTGPALEQATRFREVERLASFPFPNQPVSFRNIGLLKKSFRVFNTLPDQRVLELPAALDGAILVDTSSLPRSGMCLQKNGIDNERWSKLRRCGEPNPVAVLPRGDLKVHVFLMGDDKPEGVRETSHRVRVGTSEGSKVFRGYYVNEYTELRLPNEPGSFFFSVQQVIPDL